jgi:hypothetical protein
VNACTGLADLGVHGTPDARLRPTNGVYKDSIDYRVFSGECEIGRIYERRGFADDVRWSWSL